MKYGENSHVKLIKYDENAHVKLMKYDDNYHVKLIKYDDNSPCKANKKYLKPSKIPLKCHVLHALYAALQA